MATSRPQLQPRANLQTAGQNATPMGPQWQQWQQQGPGASQFINPGALNSPASQDLPGTMPNQPPMGGLGIGPTPPMSGDLSSALPLGTAFARGLYQQQPTPGPRPSFGFRRGY
jgi:hypothetical protein